MSSEANRLFWKVYLLSRMGYFMNIYDEKPFLNIGTGEDISIKELANLVNQIVGTNAKLVFDTSKPDGTPRKLMDVSRLHQLGWKHQIGLEEGIRSVYEDVKNGF